MDDVGGVLKCLVANLVAAAVIDLLHVVDVHEYELCLVEVAQQVVIDDGPKAFEAEAVEQACQLVTHIQIIQTRVHGLQHLLLARALDGARQQGEHDGHEAILEDGRYALGDQRADAGSAVTQRKDHVHRLGKRNLGRQDVAREEAGVDVLVVIHQIDSCTSVGHQQA